MADNINVSKRNTLQKKKRLCTHYATIKKNKKNTLPVLYNINVSTVILPPRQHYIYIYIYIYIFRNMKPYNERKMKTI